MSYGRSAAAAAPKDVSFFDQSFDPRIDGVLGPYKWKGGAITYADPDSSADYEAGYGESLTGLAQLSDAQFRTARAALDTAAPGGGDGFTVEGFTALDIRYAGHGSGDATLRFVNSDDPATAYAYLPSRSVAAGDAFFGPSGRAPVTGNYDHLTMIHEIGHTLGLKHGHEDTDFGALPTEWDSMEFSVMTYRSYIGGGVDGYVNERYGYAQTYMMLDIAALQDIYGADFETNAGATVYTWDPATGEARVNGVVALSPGANRIFETVWDGGGNDTYDLSNYATNLKIDLTPGGHSVFSAAQLAYLGGGPNGGYARGNVFNALQYEGDPRSLIERAIGGSGNDSITGNKADNALLGGEGADKIFGGGGDDSLSGGLGGDNLRGADGDDRLGGGYGADVLSGGRGSDVFVFNTAGTSTPAARDIVRANDRGAAFDGAGAAAGDRISLHDIDANLSMVGNQDFTFGGSHGVGKVWATSIGLDTYIRANIDGDAAVEFELAIEDGSVLASTYTAADFIL